jgi:hypothetical protein
MTVQSPPHSLWFQFLAELQGIHRVTRSHPVNFLKLSKRNWSFQFRKADLLNDQFHYFSFSILNDVSARGQF